MTEQEKIDLASQKQVHDLMKSCLSAMRDFTRMSAEELKNTGHKTIESGIVATYRYYQKQIDKVWKDHIKQYPDSVD